MKRPLTDDVRTFGTLISQYLAKERLTLRVSADVAAGQNDRRGKGREGGRKEGRKEERNLGDDRDDGGAGGGH